MERTVIYQTHVVLVSSKQVVFHAPPGRPAMYVNLPKPTSLLHIWLHVNHIRKGRRQKEVGLNAVKRALKKLVWAGFADECHHPSESLEMNYMSPKTYVRNPEEFRSEIAITPFEKINGHP